VLLYLNDGVATGKPKDGVRVAEAGNACVILGARPLFAGQVDGDAVVEVGGQLSGQPRRSVRRCWRGGYAGRMVAVDRNPR